MWNGSSGSSASICSGIGIAAWRILDGCFPALRCIVNGERDRDLERDLPRLTDDPDGTAAWSSISLALSFPFPLSAPSVRCSITNIPNSADPRLELFPLTLRRATIPDPLCTPSSEPAVGETPDRAAICLNEGTDEEI